MKFRIVGSKGDQEYEVAPEMALVKFNELLDDKYIPMQETPEGSKEIKEFSIDLDNVTWLHPVAGG